MTLLTRPFVILSLLNAFTGPIFVLGALVTLWYTSALLPILLAVVVGAAAKLAYSLFFNQLLSVTEKDAIFITGASRGLGQESTLRLVDRGCTVFAGVRSAEDGEKLVQLVNPKSKGRIIPVICDVAKPETIQSALKQVQAAIEAQRLVLRAVINNSAIGAVCALEIVDIEQVKKEFDVNVFGVMLVNQAFLPLLRETATNNSLTDKRARLVLMSSLAGRVTTPFMASYSATKYALEALADGYRLELRGSGIDVCVIEPGKMATKSQYNIENAIPSSDDLRKSIKIANPSVVDQYAKTFDTIRSKFNKGTPFPVDMVVTDIEHAVRAQRVLPRYQASPDATIGVFVISRLPENVRDPIMRFVIG